VCGQGEPSRCPHGAAIDKDNQPLTETPAGGVGPTPLGPTGKPLKPPPARKGLPARQDF